MQKHRQFYKSFDFWIGFVLIVANLYSCITVEKFHGWSAVFDVIGLILGVVLVIGSIVTQIKLSKK